MTDRSKTAVVLLSGGMDSTVLLHYVARSLGYASIRSLSYNYRQRHDRELECARWQARAAGVEGHEEMDISFLGDSVKGATALVSDGGEVPDLSDLNDSQLDQPPTYVPNRNMILLSIAVAYAEALGIRDVFYGAQAQDEYGYWDCTAEFLERINAVLSLNRRDTVTIHAPFVDKKKSDLVSVGLELGVNFSHTWSCYRGGQVACGSCPTCVERLNAFEATHAPDPLEYAVS